MRRSILLILLLILLLLHQRPRSPAHSFPTCRSPSPLHHHHPHHHHRPHHHHHHHHHQPPTTLPLKEKTGASSPQPLSSAHRSSVEFSVLHSLPLPHPHYRHRRLFDAIPSTQCASPPS